MCGRYILFILVVVFSGCCKQYCVFQTLNLGFVGFHGADIDTLHIDQYKKGTGFQTLIDSSTYTSTQFDNDTLYVALSDESNHIDLSNDILISGQAFPGKYYITDIVVGTENCPCSGQRIKRVRSCKVNDVLRAGELIYLRK